MSQRRALDVIEVANPCTANWEEMSGDDQRRYCSHCKKFVHNLSAMPVDEAEKLICASGGSRCVRFARHPMTGAPLMLNYASRPQTSRRRALLSIASIIGAISVAGAWGAARILRKPAPTPPPIVMGEMVCPTPPAPAQGKTRAL